MLTFLFILLFLSLSLSAQDNSSYYFKHHEITLPINNIGVLADVVVNDNQAQMRLSGNNILFSGGFFLSGYANGTLCTNGVASASRIEDYLPGSYKYSQYDDLANMFILKKSDEHFGESWQNWKDAVKLGADFYDGDNDGIYDPIDKNGNGKWDKDEDRPDLLGDQTAWCAYKDAVPNDLRYFRNIKPQGIEIQQTVFASSINESFENTVFVRYRIENIGFVAKVLDSVYFSICADPDLGEYRDDLVGCDTLIDAGYVYQTKPDTSFEENTPSLIMHFAQGPASYIPNKTYLDINNNDIFDSLDTPLINAYNVKGSILGTNKILGAENLKISSFSNFIPSMHEPEIENEYDLRIKMLGYSTQESLVDPCNFSDISVVLNEDCSNISPYYWYSGDPLYLKGWINTREFDQRIIINTGPFQLFKNKPVDIVVAYTIGESDHPLRSLKMAKINARNAQFYFRNNAFESSDNEAHIMSTHEPVFNFRLEQNFPNPFNPSTNIYYTIPFSDVPQNVTLKVYNLLGEVITTLVDELQTAGNYTVEFSSKGLSSGVYFYTMRYGDKYEKRKMMLLH